MLNLDTEDWGEIFIGCAGGGDSAITADVQLQAAPAGLVAMEVKVSFANEILPRVVVLLCASAGGASWADCHGGQVPLLSLFSCHPCCFNYWYW